MFNLKNYLSAVLVLSFGIFNADLIAQDGADDVEEVVVTGTRLNDPNLSSVSGVVAVDASDVAERGVVAIEELLADLPQISLGQNITDSNGANGSSTISLRGIGSDRTMTLVNGKRMAPGTINGGSAANINNIPVALVKEVQIVTGGASSVYGSDAIGGVVNFILDDNFEGFKASYTHSFYNHKNEDSDMRAFVEAAGYPQAPGTVNEGDNKVWAVMFGASLGDNGNMVAYIQKRERDGILQSQYDVSACALWDGGPQAADPYGCGGSGTTPWGRFATFGGSPNDNDFNYGVKAGTNEFEDWPGPFNYGPFNYFQRPTETLSTGFFADYEIADGMNFYASANIMDDRTVSQIAPSGAFFITDEISCANPLMSAQQFKLICTDQGLTVDDMSPTFLGRRNLEGGGRQQDIRHNSYRYVLGVEGELDGGLTYDVSYSNSETAVASTYMNDLSITRIKRALDVVADADGNPVCRSVVNGTDSGCLPWNVFVNNGNQIVADEADGVTQAVLDYLIVDLYARGEVYEEIWQAVVSGTVQGLNGANLVLGLESRTVGMDNRPDSGFLTGDGAGQGGPTKALGGEYSVDDIFFEMGIPVNDQLSVDLGARVSDYSTGQDTNTWKVGAKYTLNDKVTLRGTAQYAVRHGNVFELYGDQFLGLWSGSDPCAGTAPTASAAECALTGVTGAQYGTIPDSPAGQYNAIYGGNPDVNPEEADTISFGVVMELTDNLTVSVDYSDISIEGAIGSVSPSFSLDNCISTGSPLLCSNINRNSTNGNLWIGSGADAPNVVSTTLNLGELATSGYDVIANYSMDTPMGPLKIRTNIAIADTFDITEVVGFGTAECVGYWDGGGTCGSPTFELQTVTSASLELPKGNLTVTHRYLDEIEDLGPFDSPIDAQNYIDTAFSTSIGDITIYVGVNNLFDAEAPVLDDLAPNGNTFPSIYDAFGRYIFTNVSYQF
jgi:outer membrane receptor protein involved in Fe transport